MNKKKIAIFISGRGSNFKAIAEEIKKGNIDAEIDTVISDNSDAKGLFYAKENSIEYVIFEKLEESRSEYFQKIISFLEKRNIDLIVLAGFMKILSANIINTYENRIINIHPALLPSFPGTNAQKQALDCGVKYTGCTVHFVDEGVDTGPIISQEVVPILDEDTEETLSDRILKKEHIIYSEAIRLFCENKFSRLEIEAYK